MPSTAATARRPNAIWVFGDHHRAQACGFAGDQNVHTPNLDRLAAEGATFTAAVARNERRKLCLSTYSAPPLSHLRHKASRRHA